MIQMKYSTLQFCILALSCCIVMIGCGVTPSIPIVERETIIFEYAPNETVVPGSADVTFAVVDTQVNIDGFTAETGDSLFTDFASSLTKDFMEILTARGFGVKGPFNTYDEMTFPDKNGSDLILTATFEINSDMSRVPLRISSNGSRFSLNPFAETVVSVKGRIDLVLSESLTNERMWTKSVPITPFRVSLPRLTELPSSFWHTPSRQFLEEVHSWDAYTVESLLVASGAVPPDWSLPVVDVSIEPPYGGYSGLDHTTKKMSKASIENMIRAKETSEAERENIKKSLPSLEAQLEELEADKREYDKVEARRNRQKAQRESQANRRLRVVKTTNFIAILIQRNAFHNSFGIALQAPYREIMNKTFGYLNPEEMALLKKQSQELRERKVY